MMSDWWVHVNRHVIDRNRKTGSSDPAITVKRGRRGRSMPAHEVELPAGSVMLSSPHEPLLDCGARVAIRCPTEPQIIR